MKKTILALMLGLLLTGCASNVENNVDSDTDSTSTAVTQEDSEANDIEEKNKDSTSLPRMNSYTADDNGYCANFDVVKFGSYEQDGIDNGTEAIEWYVIAREDGKALLFSRYILEGAMYKEYDNSEDITWENSDLRRWLNEDFCSQAFVDEERSMIQETKLINKDNPVWGTFGGNDTIDKVFILGIDEIAKYFDFTYKNETNSEYDYASEDLYSTATTAAYKTLSPITDEYTEERYSAFFDKMCYSNKDIYGTIQPYFWVRTVGREQYDVCYCKFGYVCEDNYNPAGTNYGVRPAIWVDEAALTMYQ